MFVNHLQSRTLFSCVMHTLVASTMRVPIGLAILLPLAVLVGCRPAAEKDAAALTRGKTHWQDYFPSSQASGSGDTTALASEPELRPTGTVGSAACVECHEDQVASYESTSHHHSARWIGDSGEHVPARFGHEPSHRLYGVALTDGGLVHSEQILGHSGELIASDSADVVLELGSGLHAHSYVTERDGFWIQSPLTWYTQPQKWDLSPGYDPTVQATFDRVVTTDCVLCHVGRIKIRDDDINRFSIEEVSIGCERCHGPAEQHVSAQRAALSDKHGEPGTATAVPVAGGRDVINPLSLSRERQEAVCSQCHLQGIISAGSSGFNRWDFVPGELLADSITHYQLHGVDTQFRIVGHTEQMHESACYTQSETLTCTTCHNPHSPPPSMEAYRQSCLECHQSEGCGLPEDERIRTQSNDCSACHMPIRPTNVTHAALHDHRIAVHDRSFVLAGREPPVANRPPAESNPDSPSLVAITDQSQLDLSHQQRRWSLAMHSLAFQGLLPDELIPEYRRAATLLLELHRQGITDPSTQASLARDYLEANHLAAARDSQSK